MGLPTSQHAIGRPIYQFNLAGPSVGALLHRQDTIGIKCIYSLLDWSKNVFILIIPMIVREVWRPLLIERKVTNMQNEMHKSSSESSVLSREQFLKTILEGSEEVLLEISRVCGEDSPQMMIAEKFLDTCKKEYESLVARREYHDLCEKHHMMFDAAGIQEIKSMLAGKIALKTMFPWGEN